MKKYYAVRRGFHRGIFNEFKEALAEVKGYSCPQWRGFNQLEAAQQYMKEYDDGDDPEGHEYWVWEDEIHDCRSRAYQESYGTFCEPFYDPHDAMEHVFETYPGFSEKYRQDLQHIDHEGDTIYEVYVDGACAHNGQSGAIAGIGVFFGNNHPGNVSQRLLIGAQTNQRAELAAIKRAYEMIESLDRNNDYYEIYSDSEYAINCLTKWHKAWKKNGWRTSTGKEVANRDLIESILELRNRDSCGYITGIIKVPAHSDCEGNNEADRLARRACS
ncbi:Ribonuclease H1 [Yarrowia sp. C11]|nr:Ribonuclease H1 [Yarrowia sp. C11]KAG5358711.1 Ribonuclease H1 [Yarrowia sp. E02]